MAFLNELLHVLRSRSTGTCLKEAAAAQKRNDGEHLGASSQFQDGEEIGKIITQDISSDWNRILAISAPLHGLTNCVYWLHNRNIDATKVVVLQIFYQNAQRLLRWSVVLPWWWVCKQKLTIDLVDQRCIMSTALIKPEDCPSSCGLRAFDSKSHPVLDWCILRLRPMKWESRKIPHVRNGMEMLSLCFITKDLHAPYNIESDESWGERARLERDDKISGLKRHSHSLLTDITFLHTVLKVYLIWVFVTDHNNTLCRNFKCLVVRSILFCLLGHEPHIGNISHSAVESKNERWSVWDDIMYKMNMNESLLHIAQHSNSRNIKLSINFAVGNYFLEYCGITAIGDQAFGVF